MNTDIETLSQESEQAIRALPALQEIASTKTLWEYFAKKVSPVLSMKEKNSENVLISKLIVDEIKRLYGETTADIAKEQLKRLPVIETGTHLMMLRDYENPDKQDEASRLNQNVIISSALIKAIGGKVHIGSYSSNVTLSQPLGAGYYQVGDELFPITTNKNLNSYMLYHAPDITDEYFNDTILEISKLSALRGLLKDCEQTPHVTTALKTIDVILAPVDNNKNNYKAVQATLDKTNPTKKKAIYDAMISLDSMLVAKKGYGFDDIDNQFQGLKKVFQRKDLSLCDKIALIQSSQINSVVKEGDIEHVSIDSMDITKKFLIETLKDKNSLWYNIFNDKELFAKFHDAFACVRSSWKDNESPFDILHQEKGYVKTRPLHKDAIKYDPAEIIDLLEKEKMIPSTSLMVLVYQSADMMIHGGFFQSTYAKKMQKRFQTFLVENGYDKRAENVGKIPSDMMILSLAVESENGIPCKLGEIVRMSPEEKKNLMNNIPIHSSSNAVQCGLQVVPKFLNRAAPGYLEHEAKTNENSTKEGINIKKLLLEKVVIDNIEISRGR